MIFNKNKKHELIEAFDNLIVINHLYNSMFGIKCMHYFNIKDLLSQAVTYLEILKIRGKTKGSLYLDSEKLVNKSLKIFKKYNYEPTQLS